MEPEYPVLVTRRDGDFEVRIRELLLVERGPNLADVYARLMDRKREIIQWARTIDSFDELPPPTPAASLHSPLPGVPSVNLSAAIARGTAKMR